MRNQSVRFCNGTQADLYGNTIMRHAMAWWQGLHGGAEFGQNLCSEERENMVHFGHPSSGLTA